MLTLGEKSLAASGNWTCVSGMTVRCSTNLAAPLFMSTCHHPSGSWMLLHEAYWKVNAKEAFYWNWMLIKWGWWALYVHMSLSIGLCIVSLSFLFTSTDGGGEHLWESTFSHPSHKRHWCQETSLLRVSRLMLIMTGALYVQEAQAQPFQWNLSSSFGVSKNSENNIFSTVIYLMEVTIFHLTHNFSCSWELRTQKLKSYLLRTQSLNVCS